MPGADNSVPRIGVPHVKIVCAGIDILVIRGIGNCRQGIVGAGNAQADCWSIWYGVHDPQPRLPGLGFADVDRVRLELNVSQLPDDGEDMDVQPSNVTEPCALPQEYLPVASWSRRGE